MNIITIREISKQPQSFTGKELEICGWVRSVRASKNFGFVVLSDGTYFQPLQIVYGEKATEFLGGFKA